MESLYWLYLIILYLFKFFHLCLLVFVFFGPFFLDKFWLLILILYNCYTLTCWYTLGHCLLTPIEEAIERNVKKYHQSGKNNEKYNKKEKNDEQKSFIAVFIEKQFPNIDDTKFRRIYGLIPFVSTFICLARLNYM